MFWTNQFIFLIWKRIFIWKRCGINSCITNTFFIDSWSSPANSRHCNCRLALGQLPQQGPQLAGTEKFCVRFVHKGNSETVLQDSGMILICWEGTMTTWARYDDMWTGYMIKHGAGQLSKTMIKCRQNLNDCPSGHWQEGLPLPHGFPGLSPHFLLSMSDLRMIAMIMMVILTVFETLPLPC